MSSEGKIKHEIRKILEKDNVKDDSLTVSSDLKWVLQNIENHISLDKPDAYLPSGEIVYAIEHFSLSFYYKDENGDISKAMDGRKKYRRKMKEDISCDFNPDVRNFISAIQENLESHSKSFPVYKQNLRQRCPQAKEFRLIIFMENFSEIGEIMDAENRIIHPLCIEGIAEAFFPYKNDVWAIILSYGHNQKMYITGITISELLKKYEEGKLLKDKDCCPVGSMHYEHISKENSDYDTKRSIVLLDCKDSKDSTLCKLDDNILLDILASNEKDSPIAKSGNDYPLIGKVTPKSV